MLRKNLIVEGEPLEADDGAPSAFHDEGLQAALADWRTAQRDLAEARNAAANVATRLEQLDAEISDLRLQASQRPCGAFADLEAVKAHARKSALLQAEIDALVLVSGELRAEYGKRQSEQHGFQILVGDAKRACWLALLNQIKASLPTSALDELPHTAVMAGLSRSELTDFLLPGEDSDQCFSIAQKYGIPV